jgi:hypothetical protein
MPTTAQPANDPMTIATPPVDDVDLKTSDPALHEIQQSTSSVALTIHLDSSLSHDATSSQ